MSPIQTCHSHMSKHAQRRQKSTEYGKKDSETKSLFARTSEILNKNLKSLFFNVISASLILGLIISVSIFTYGSFYFAYMPNTVYQESLNLQFTPCGHTAGMCSYPHATLQLERSKQLMMMTGQTYSISAMMKLPQTPNNQLQGIFMSCVKLYGKDKHMLTKSCKSSTPQIKSQVLKMMETIFYSPLLLSSIMSAQSQWITEEYFADFIDDPEDSLSSMDQYVLRSVHQHSPCHHHFPHLLFQLVCC